MIPAGRLRHPITIQEATYTQDAETGEMVPTWTDIATEWAAIEGINGREFLAAQAEQAENVYRITLRHRATESAWRIVSEGVTYEITAILPDNIKSQITLMCKTL